ncbi:MAG: ribonuclease HII [Candidatus Omnitrophica bacterium]|nr:ribonuclease HII [Candidatus Omnitrophota bacterium]
MAQNSSNKACRHKIPRPGPWDFIAQSKVVAGVDEAGCGPWAGPVVAAAVVLRRRLRGVRIDDSKRLSARQRLYAYQAILDDALIGVGIVPALMIDLHNIRQAALQAMEQAVANLPCTPGLVLVDGQQVPRLTVPCQPLVGGDHLSYPIACASIIAKVTRDRLMTFYHRLFPAYRFDQHKGYGTTLHLEALRTWGPCPIHRMSFRPVLRVASDMP